VAKPAEPSGKPRSGWLKSAAVSGRERVERVTRGIEASRDRVGPIDIAFVAAERDRSAGGALLAGALAFRAFLWLLPAALTTVLILGLTASTSETSPEKVVKDSGLPSLVASTVAQARDQDNRGRILAIAASLIFLWSASGSLLKAARAVHAFAWRVPLRKPKSRIKATAMVILLLFGAGALSALASVLRNASPGIGIGFTLTLIVAYALVWWLFSVLLPHADAPAFALFPGAVLMGVALQAMQLVTLLYLAPKLSSSSELYGDLGGAAVLLLWLYIIGRVIVASAMLNAALWTRRRDRQGPTTDEPSTVTA
jgi:uncharacterized BrkB/YihY/UPF0761 family membrane protein